MQTNLLSSLEISSSALDAERMRLDVIASNLANSRTTKGVDGEVYRRQEVLFESFLTDKAQQFGKPQVGVRVAGVREDDSVLPKVYQPGHPHADESGMVTMPNVNVVSEMTDLITASRSYEANTKVVNTGRQMAQNALSIGK